jgi:hypothetical protein
MPLPLRTLAVVVAVAATAALGATEVQLPNRVDDIYDLSFGQETAYQWTNLAGATSDSDGDASATITGKDKLRFLCTRDFRFSSAGTISDLSIEYRVRTSRDTSEYFRVSATAP